MQTPARRDLTGLEVSSDGRTIAYTSGTDDHSRTSLTVRRAGRPDLVANISRYEARHNPDGGATYGILAGGNPCAEAILADLSGGAATYTGGVDSHPYAVTRLRSGWAVADAGANAILGVSESGVVSTIAVLPAQSTTLTQSQVDALTASVGAPPGALQCLVGVTYGFEPVPTDVERGEDGMLYVSTLPGGPEDPSLGARGSVYRVDPRTGRSRLVATGFLGATDLAVGEDDEIYVTEFFGGKVDKIVHGRVSTVRTGGAPLSLEVDDHVLYIGYAGRRRLRDGRGALHRLRQGRAAARLGGLAARSRPPGPRTVTGSGPPLRQVRGCGPDTVRSRCRLRPRWARGRARARGGRGEGRGRDP